MGVFGSKAAFNADRDIPDLSGKVILVTGGNVGLGKESILQFAKHNPKTIYMGSRSETKAHAAIAEIQKAVPGAHIAFLKVDLASFASIKQAADTFKAETDRLDILVNNAGVLGRPLSLTEDGYEIQFGTNHMGTALLTKLLLPVLEKTAAAPGSDVRVVTVSSEVHKWAPKPGLLLSENKTTLPNLSAVARYAQSKLANIYFTQVLAKKYPNIKTVTLHPGIVKTNITQGAEYGNRLLSAFVAFGNIFISVDVHTGTLTQLWASTAKNVKSGAFYYPVGKEYTGQGLATDEKQAQELWDWTENELREHGF
ncbi:hypothetical protein LTR84_012719 [Exophiala bonariae]|uniref:NAD(P)-binding protein n=1 Tax=Exophiala bonariae TaxID=1690606 RepID=A0AAV9NHE6_9EURO|nr:hypothetical protein LTR84_012719 [Exophiala bonariae]